MGSKVLQTIVIIALALIIAGCASQYAPARINDPYGFFSGILHGFLCPFALLGKLLSWIMSLFGVSILKYVTIIGFVLGLGASFGGGGSQVNR